MKLGILLNYTGSCIVNMVKIFATTLEIRKLIVKLCNEDNLLIRDISKTVWKSKSVIYSILRKLKETGSCKAKNTPPGRPRKTTAREDRWSGNKLKKDWFATATAISKRANANLGIKISRHTISRRLNEIKVNSRVASTKLYISKKNKMSQLKFATEYVKWAEEQWDCVNFSNNSKFNLFDCDWRRFVQCSPKERYSPQCSKSSLKFGVMVFIMISATSTGPLVRTR